MSTSNSATESRATPGTSPITLPIITLQPTFLSVIADVDSGLVPSDKFWISCYKTGSPSVHSKITATLDEVDRNLVILEPVKDGSGEVGIRRNGVGAKYTVTCPTLGVPHTKILLPIQEYADPERSNPQHPHRITAFDISPDNSQFATGFLDGSVHFYPTSPATTNATSPIKKTSKAHLSSITSLRFFPSSRVLLSAGADFSLAILPADPLEVPSSSPPSGPTTVTRITPARTLRGHTRSITSTEIISRGRNVLSSSQDGTIRLWDVGGGQQIRAMSAGKGKYVPVAAMSMGERGEGEAGRKRPDGEELGPDENAGTSTGGIEPDPREVETRDKVIFCALQDGSFEAFDLGSKHSIYHSFSNTSPKNPPSAATSPALSSITYSPTHNLLATGSTNGIVTLYDTRSLAIPLTSFSRNTACIEDLVLTDTGSTSSSRNTPGDEEVGLVVATEDGLPYVASVRPEGPGVLAELVGGDCDGVRTVRVGKGGEIWTAADDGIVRRYVRW